MKYKSYWKISNWFLKNDIFDKDRQSSRGKVFLHLQMFYIIYRTRSFYIIMMSASYLFPPYFYFPVIQNDMSNLFDISSLTWASKMRWIISVHMFPLKFSAYQSVNVDVTGGCSVTLIRHFFS